MIDATTSTAANKAVVSAFFERANSQGIRDAIEHLPPDLTWWGGGITRAKPEMLATLDLYTGAIAGPLTMRVNNLTAEENRVAAHVVSHAALKNGKTYANTYHFLFLFRDGEIVEVQEHCDTKLAADAFGDL